MRLTELADTPSFDPERTGMDPRDMKPWRGKKPRGWRLEILQHRTRCLVVGCGLPYAAGGVCGYCREMVKRERKQRKAGG